MKRPAGLLSIAIATSVILALASFEARAARPNVLLIVADDHAPRVMGIEGDPRDPTPNLDRLARQGVRFERAFCNSPVCTASRQSFITGRLPHAVGVTLLPTPLPEDALTLGEWFRQAGYHTAAFGKMHFNGPSHHGFTDRIDTPAWNAWLRENLPEGADHRRPWRPFATPAAEWLNAENRSMGLPERFMESTFLAERAAEFFEARKEAPEPFLLVVGLHEPHSPFHYPDEYTDRFSPEGFPAYAISDADRRDQPLIFKELSPEQKQGIQAAYETSVAFLDANVGKILEGLDGAGLSEETIVVYISDHGYMLGQHGRFEKHVFFDPAIRVPFLVRWPGHLPEDRAVDGMVELIDLFPTLTELCGLDNPDGLQGRSLVPLLRGEPDAKGQENVFAEYLENEEAMIRTERYKLIVGTGHRARQDGYTIANPTPGPYTRLYDLQADPDESTDLSEKPEMAEVVERLQHALHERLVTTRGGQRPVPQGFSELDAIHWCLVPRDVMPEPPARKP